MEAIQNDLVGLEFDKRGLEDHQLLAISEQILKKSVGVALCLLSSIHTEWNYQPLSRTAQKDGPRV